MAAKTSYDFNKVDSIEKGSSWMPITYELLNSIAWKALPINSKRLIEFLIIEHISKSRRENGYLKAPYNQLVEHGISRGKIREAISDAVSLGLIEFEAGRYKGDSKSECNLYTLTFEPKKCFNKETGAYYWCSRTNNWRHIKEGNVVNWKQGKKNYSKNKESKKKSNSH